MTPTYKGFDQILTEYVGGRGRYQLKITLLMTPLYWLTLPLLFLIVFSAYVPKHRCKVSACENITGKVSFFLSILPNPNIKLCTCLFSGHFKPL